MKLLNLPIEAQIAACEVMKNVLSKTLHKEPALELARTINAVFTELYFPSATIAADKEPSDPALDVVLKLEKERWKLIAPLYPEGTGRAGESLALDQTGSNSVPSSDSQDEGSKTQAENEFAYVVLHLILRG